MRFGLKQKMLSGFVSTAAAIIVAIAAVVYWQLDRSTDSNAELISKLVRANAETRAGGHLRIYENFVSRIRDGIVIQSSVINNKEGVAFFLEFGHLQPLAEVLKTGTDMDKVSFAAFFDLEGNQSALLPQTKEKIGLKQQFGALVSDDRMPDLLKSDGKSGTGAISAIMELDAGFVANSGLDAQVPANQKAVAIVTAVAVQDDYQQPVGFLVLGRLLNEFNAPLEQLNNITSSAFVLFADGTAIASAGFGSMAPHLDKALEKRLAAQPEGQGAILEAGGEKFISFCQPIRLANGTNPFVICSGVPETEVLSAQSQMKSYGRATSNAVQLSIVIVGLIAIAIFVVLAIIMAGRIVDPLTRMTKVTGQLAGGDLDAEIPGGERADEIGEMARSLEQIRTVGVMAARAQSSLNDASSPMMIVDAQGRVIFPNKAMVKLYEDLAGDLCADLAGFGNGALPGQAFDALHNSDAMQTERLMALDEPASTRMIAGGRTIDMTASPVFNEAGDRLGAVVEWQDRTGQVAVEREIAGIVLGATEGDFSQRLTEADKSGFMADLANGINELLDVVDGGLSQVVKIMSALAEGDLTKRMAGKHKGAFARLKQDADRMGEQMEAIVGRIAEVSGAIQTATDEISSGISDLSLRSEHQASSLEETTASMEELSATVRQNSDNAQDANQVAIMARDSATSGGAVAERAMAAMGGIAESSKRITEIVGLIQEIAFQTNLLALNASVEAARAGESGRGFAVVANEVRALAQRAASASKDIKELISDSDGRVQDGVRLVGEAGSALGEIVTSVKKVADFVSEIAAASQEQTTGIEQVSSAITGMDEMTQQNAALVEETTASIQSAVSQVADLQAAVGFFKTAQDARATAISDAGGVSETPWQQLRKVAGKMADKPKHRVRSTGTGTAMADDGWEEF